MGENKAELIYHDRPQWAYAAQLISPYCREVYFSLKQQEQVPDIPPELIITDDPRGEGPISGLLAAFNSNPSAAWLVLSVGMPGVDRALINRIFRLRDASKAATCLMMDGRIEPLLSIWEPSASTGLSQYADRGKNSLRQFLQQQEIQAITIDASMSYKLDSYDTPDDRQNFLRKGRK